LSWKSLEIHSQISVGTVLTEPCKYVRMFAGRINRARDESVHKLNVIYQLIEDE